MSRDVISICNELDALSGRFNPDHVTYLRHHTQKLNGIALVNTLVEELANAPALTLPELYRKVEMLAGLCDADSHPQTGGISNLLNALELSDPAALSHWQKAAQEISKALADTGGPSEVRLLASIWADVAQLSQAKAVNGLLEGAYRHGSVSEDDYTAAALFVFQAIEEARQLLMDVYKALPYEGGPTQ